LYFGFFYTSIIFNKDSFCILPLLYAVDHDVFGRVDDELLLELYHQEMKDYDDHIQHELNHVVGLLDLDRNRRMMFEILEFHFFDLD
jgi:hypothetical protein